jgi:hypothetical protein
MTHLSPLSRRKIIYVRKLEGYHEFVFQRSPVGFSLPRTVRAVIPPP